MGIAFKAGHFPTARRRAGWYYDFYANDGLARWQRNYLSAAIPFGVAVGSMTAAALVAPSPDRANGAEIGLVLVAFAGFAIRGRLPVAEPAVHEAELAPRRRGRQSLGAR